MRRQSIVTFAAAAVMTAAAAAAGQAPDGWTAPRTADGRPDLGGVWASDSATPLQRPEALGDREFLTEEEVAALAAHANDYSAVGGDAVFGETPFRAGAGRPAGTAGERASPAGPATGDGQLQPVLDERPLVREPHVADRRSAQRAAAGPDRRGAGARPAAAGGAQRTAAGPPADVGRGGRAHRPRDPLPRRRRAAERAGATTAPTRSSRALTTSAFRSRCTTTPGSFRSATRRRARWVRRRPWAARAAAGRETRWWSRPRTCRAASAARRPT